MDRAEAINIMNSLHNRWATWRGVSGADTPEVMQAITMAITALKKQEKVQAMELALTQKMRELEVALTQYQPSLNQWISVKDETPPEDDTEYEVCCDYLGERRIEIHKGWNMHCVTHWRPLPETPKEGADHE